MFFNMSQAEAIECALNHLIMSHLKYNDSAYCASLVIEDAALLTLFSASKRDLNDFSAEEQEIIKNCQKTTMYPESILEKPSRNPVEQ